MLDAIPQLTFYQFDTTESSPSGQRHVKGGSFAFEKVLSSGICVSGLQFPDVVLDLSNPVESYASTPVAIIFRIDDISVGSGIDNFRFYLSKDSALNGYGNEPRAFIQMAVSGIWQQNCVLPSGAGEKLVADTIPTYPNVFRQDGKVFIDGIGDSSVSQYIYLNVIVPSGFPLGDVGICGSGNLEFCLLYDYAEIT